MSPLSPILVGVGRVCDRGGDLATKREPLALIEAASRLALEDASCLGLAEQIDSVRVVNMLSGAACEDPAGALAGRLGLPSGERLYTAIGGNAPQWLVNRAADDVVSGRCGAVHAGLLTALQREEMVGAVGNLTTRSDGRNGFRVMDG